MATAILHSLPVASHELWQTSASPFILPPNWQTMYQQCPRCGGNAPNVCDAVWPANWWEDDMMGLMYQGHIPPSQRTAPWDHYYAKFRVMPSQPYPTPLGTHFAMLPQVPYAQIDQHPMTPGTTHSRFYAILSTTPTGSTLPHLMSSLKG